MKWEIAIFNPGDYIRVKRDYYYHYGIYVGNNEVIHFTGPSDDGINTPNKVLVRKTSIKDFLKGGVGEKAFYSKKESLSLRKPDDIINYANSRIDEGGYDMINNNCEHFALSIIQKKEKKKREKYAFLHTLARIFFKVTGWFAYIIYLKPRYYYSNKQAKKESRDLKDGAILVANHTSIYDYYIFLFRYWYKVVHTLTAEIIYKNKYLKHLCNILGNIEVDRTNPLSKAKSFETAKEYLNNKKVVLIFPEGHFEKQKGVLEKFDLGAIKLAIETNKPIIPFYFMGNRGLFKRTRYIVGNKIYVRDLINSNDPSSENLEKVCTYLENTINNLKHQLNAYEKCKTQAVISKRTFTLDLMKICSLPLGYLIVRAKKIYIGNKKEIKKAYKEKVLLAANHTSIYDVPYLYMYLPSRRTRVVAISSIWNKKFFAWFINRAGVIKYKRNENNGFDIECFKEVNGVLEANGAVAIFPQGHITEENAATELKGGLSMFSLMNNSPIIPIYFAEKTELFKKVHFMIGDVIYPSDCFKDCVKVNSQNVEIYNEYITNKINEFRLKSDNYLANKNHKKHK